MVPDLKMQTMLWLMPGVCLAGMLKIRIGHFRVSSGLCFKTRVSAQPLIWKSFFILVQIKLIFTRKVVHLASFWKWGFLELGSGLLIGALQAGRQSERGTGSELRVGAHYRNRKWEAKDFDKVYTVVCGTTNYLFSVKEPHQLADEYINAVGVIAFCFYLMNKMRRNLIKIRSYAIFK